MPSNLPPSGVVLVALCPRWYPTSWGLCKPVTTEGGWSPVVEPERGATFYDLFPSKIRKILGVGKPRNSG